VRTYLKKAPPKAPVDRTKLEETVRAMLADIAANGDAAVKRFAAKLDRWDSDEFRVSDDQIRRVTREMPETFKEDFEYARRKVTDFAKQQLHSMHEFETEIEPGIMLGQKLIPVSCVGCYIPGGKYPLVSAAIMSVGTARVAGVEHVIGCAPPRNSDGIYPPTLYALHASGAHEIFVLGGVQALASMAYGRVGMRAVDMITGPGNAYVAEAKRQLFGAVGIDLMAGPTEICVIADDTADPEIVATDLVGQAEHGPDSPAWLVTTSRRIADAALDRVPKIAERLPEPNRTAALSAWRDYGEVVVVDTREEAVVASDRYAAEHLEVHAKDLDWWLKSLSNYGSLFLGEETTVAYGDKASGPNHILPTKGAARYTGGLSVGKFIKTVTYQRMSRDANAGVGVASARISRLEGMEAHARTADCRLAKYFPDKQFDLAG
jgi:sulfopropanediol 3-dehydrogenase